MTHKEELNKAAEEWANKDAVVYASRKKSFITGAKWFQEHYNITIQYIADGSTSAYGKQPDNWKPKI